jgi:hydroxymethylpyrimidine pyrophosphatase-like HAD family hydrolase
MAFGDGGNDNTMIIKAGIGVAMGNANEGTKKIADYITTGVDDEGIQHALQYYHII